MEFQDGVLRPLAERLCRVDGVVGVTLGGTRARGTHTARTRRNPTTTSASTLTLTERLVADTRDACPLT